jgi:Tol biopolymer transport system component
VNPSDVGVVFQDYPSLDFAGWSPDGRRIAFVATAGPADLHEQAVYVAGADGSGARRISPVSSTLSAVWSPDGRWIAHDESAGATRQVVIEHPDGSGARAVTDAGNGEFAFGPAWSPDGTWLVVVRGPGRPEQTDLWLAPVDGSGPVRLTDHVAFYSSYSWIG